MKVRRHRVGKMPVGAVLVDATFWLVVAALIAVWGLLLGHMFIVQVHHRTLGIHPWTDWLWMAALLAWGPVSPVAAKFVQWYFLRIYAARHRPVPDPAHRPHILLLRAFADDALVMPGSWGALARSIFPAWRDGPWATFEQVLAKAVRRFGYPFAIGRPDERYPRLGFHRVYTSSEEDWYDKVATHAQDAALILFVLNGPPRSPPTEDIRVRPGLGREVRLLVEGLHLWKTIFIVPPVPWPEVEARMDAFSACFNPDWRREAPLPKALCWTIATSCDFWYSRTLRKDKWPPGEEDYIRVLREMLRPAKVGTGPDA